MDLRPEDISRLLTKYAAHPLSSDEPAHVRLEASLQRLVDAVLMTAPDLAVAVITRVSGFLLAHVDSRLRVAPQ